MPGLQLNAAFRRGVTNSCEQRHRRYFLLNNKAVKSIDAAVSEWSRACGELSRRKLVCELDEG